METKGFVMYFYKKEGLKSTLAQLLCLERFLFLDTETKNFLTRYFKVLAGGCLAE
jgi:hypothetical protein